MDVVRTVTATLAVLLTGPAALAQGSSPPPDPALLALPGRLVTALAAGDAATFRADCATEATVVDEFPPYVWSGNDACARYVAAFKAFTAQAKITNITGSAKPNPFVDRSADRTYLTAQIRFNANMAGQAIREEGTWTFVLVKSGGTWKITNLAFGVLHH